MLTGEELLFAYGFVKGTDPHKKRTPEERLAMLKHAGENDKKELLKHVEREMLETADEHFENTNYPASAMNLRLVYEAANTSVEENYFWVLEHLRQDRGFHKIHKVIDMYSASEASAFWGNQQQRISAQQNNAQGLLANIGKFTKELFQMVRELRIIEERLEAYESWDKRDEKGNVVTRSDSADVTLKSIFTDVVEGGTKNPQSVFGLAQTVGFTILPDLFFNTRVYSVDKLDELIESMDYNVSVKNVLRRKLYQFIIWKDKTHRELLNRRKFNISYLKQHWGIIHMYMAWVKPYLKNVQRLQMRDKDGDPDMVSSFDQSLTEVEILCEREKEEGAIPIALVNFKFRTRPDMSVRKEYQQGPSHTGRLEMTFRAYGWDEGQVKSYIAMRAREELELLGLLDASIQANLDELGEDFDRYLKEEEAKVPDFKKKDEGALKRAKEDASQTLEPFVALFGGFKEIFGLFNPIPSKGEKDKGAKPNYKKAAGTAKNHVFLTFHIYKKGHRLLSW